MMWILLILCLVLVKSRTRISLFSPLVLFYVFFLLSIFLSIPYHYLFPESWKFNIAQLDRLDDESFWDSIQVFVKMIVYFSIGVLLYKYVFNIRKGKKIIIDFNIRSFISVNYLLIISLFIVIMDIALVIGLYGKEIFIRNEYSVDHNKFGTMLLEYSLLFLIFFGALLYKRGRIISLLIALYVVLLCIGFGSRMATIYLLVYLFVIFILYLSKGHKQILMVFGTPFILLFFGYNISLRYCELHGLGPYLVLPFFNPLEIIKHTFFNIYYTFIFGVFATSKTLIYYPDNSHYLITSLNPAPGFLTDWYSIYQELRVNHYVPFTGIGELFSFPFIAFLFYIFIGVFYAHAERTIQKLFSRKNMISAFLLFLLCTAFIPYSFEYNLRSCVRFIYYAMFLMIMISFIPKIKIKL